MRRIRVHDTRRAWGSLLVLDVHPRVAIQILRHGKISAVMEIYTMVPDKATPAALKQLSGALGPPTPCRQMSRVTTCCCTALLYKRNLCSRKLWS